jgi:hypothetical protein
MTMTTKRQQRRTTDTTDTSPVTVKVVEPHLVYHDGEQRSGTLTHVPADIAEYWQKHGWATIVDNKPKTPANTQ